MRSWLLLGRLLERHGIDILIVEQRSRDHVLARIRAGVLEHATAALLNDTNVGARTRTEGLIHHGVELCFDGDRHRIDFQALVGRHVAYGQTEVAADLMRVWKAERFSWWMTSLLLTFPDAGDFGRRGQRAEFDYMTGSRAAAESLAENYTGLPLQAASRHG